jgi:hypothetical protein
MVCVGADEIYMTRKAELGPVDPQLTVNSPAGQRQYASTDLFAYVEFAMRELGWKRTPWFNNRSAGQLLQFLHSNSGLPPDYVGKIYRMYSQAGRYIEELVDTHGEKFRISPRLARALARQLMREFGSHDYKIDSGEAAGKLRLNVLPFNRELESAVDTLYNSLAGRLKLDDPFNPRSGNSGAEEIGIIKTENAERVKRVNYVASQPAGQKLQVEMTIHPWR